MFGFDGCVISFENVVSFCKHQIVFWLFHLLLWAVCELFWKSKQWLEKCAKAIEKNYKLKHKYSLWAMRRPLIFSLWHRYQIILARMCGYKKESCQHIIKRFTKEWVKAQSWLCLSFFLSLPISLSLPLSLSLSLSAYSSVSLSLSLSLVWEWIWQKKQSTPATVWAWVGFWPWEIKAALIYKDGTSTSPAPPAPRAKFFCSAQCSVVQAD